MAEVQLGHARGWSFTPLRGKVPILKGWQSRPREALEQAIAWSRAGNVGLRTGKNSGVVVLDIDQQVVPAELIDVVTPVVRTGSGNWHFYCSVPDEPIGCPSLVLPGGQRIGEIRGGGGQVVFVGSIHPDTGGMYEWLAGRSPDDTPLAPVPPWVRQPRATRVQRPALKRTTRGDGDLVRAAQAYTARVPGAHTGARHNGALSLAAHLSGFEATHSRQRLTEHEILTLLDDWNARNLPPLPATELRNIATWFDARGANGSGPVHLVHDSTLGMQCMRRVREERRNRIDVQRRRLREGD